MCLVRLYISQFSSLQPFLQYPVIAQMNQHTSDESANGGRPKLVVCLSAKESAWLHLVVYYYYFFFIIIISIIIFLSRPWYFIPKSIRN